jgi:2-polyprenyl-3-methyl-5-hydroxy-6-metoxy-1,4-benzoquinol methylase
MDFSNRSYQQELLDGTDIPFDDIALNMKELNFINTHLGGHDITISGFKKMLSSCNFVNDELLVCEIGCGGGDNLQVIYDWCIKQKIRMQTIGIDINADCISYAQKYTRIPSAQWIASDYKLVNFSEKPHIIFNSLFCHHFNDVQMIEILKWMHENASKGFFINDLHRHQLAFYSIKVLTKLFSKSYLVKNDAPLSVQRGFKRKEIEQFLVEARIAQYKLEWKWAFRWLITAVNNTA